jgi:hypothetical protein
MSIYRSTGNIQKPVNHILTLKEEDGFPPLNSNQQK